MNKWDINLHVLSFKIEANGTQSVIGILNVFLKTHNFAKTFLAVVASVAIQLLRRRDVTGRCAVRLHTYKTSGTRKGIAQFKKRLVNVFFWQFFKSIKHFKNMFIANPVPEWCHPCIHAPGWCQSLPLVHFTSNPKGWSAKMQRAKTMFCAIAWIGWTSLKVTFQTYAPDNFHSCR